MMPVKFIWDAKEHVWIAIGEGIGLVLEAASKEDLLRKVRDAAPEMAAENGIECRGIEIQMY